MIACPVCSHENNDFAITCASCSSFIQNRIVNLDFFTTLWNIIENPSNALRSVILSEHKNYVLMLGAFYSISVVFAVFWAGSFGNLFDNILPLMVLGIVFGLVLAIPLVFFQSYVLHHAMKLVGGNGSFKNTYAVYGWSLVPLAVATAIILPIELATLGLYLFSTNPSGYEYKPLVYILLLSIHGLLVLWNFLLLARGLQIVHGKGYFLSLAVGALCISGTLTLIVFIYHQLFNT